MKSKPTQGKGHRKSQVKGVTKQGPAPANAPPDPSSVQRQNEFAEAVRQARWLHERGDEYRARLLQNIKERVQNGVQIRATTRNTAECVSQRMGGGAVSV